MTFHDKHFEIDRSRVQQGTHTYMQVLCNKILHRPDITDLARQAIVNDINFQPYPYTVYA